MTVRLLPLAALVLLAMAEPALAHPPPLGIGGVFGGLLHPLFVPAHVLAILGLGLLVGQQAEWGRAVPFAAIMALVAGLAAMTARLRAGSDERGPAGARIGSRLSGCDGPAVA